MKLKLMKLKVSEEQGQVTAFFVGVLLLIFGFMALSVDIGFFMHTRRVAQNAADSAALAGAAALPGCALYDGDPAKTKAKTLANQYLTNNLKNKTFSTGADVPTVDENASYTFTDAGGTVTFPAVYAKVTRPQSFLFGQVLGLVGVSVPADAKAACVNASTLDGICPFYIVAPNPGQTPEFDAQGNLVRGFGFDINRVYQFDFGAQGPTGANRGILDIYQSNNIHDIVRNGCTGDLQRTGPCDIESQVVSEDLDVCTKRGNTTSVRNGSNDYYNSYETGGAWPTHAQCNISFDESVFSGPPTLYANSAPLNPVAPYTPLTPAQVAARVELCNDDPYDDRVAGRLWPIAILTQVPTNGNNLYEVSYLAVMYQVCVAYTGGNNGNDCGNNPGNNLQSSLFGMFVNAGQLNISGIGGISTNPFAPKHVVLVR